MDFKNTYLLLTSSGGSLYKLDLEVCTIKKIAGVNKGYLMGVDVYDDIIYTSGSSSIYRIKDDRIISVKVSNEDLYMHHLKLINDNVYVAVTVNNDILCFDKELYRKGIYRIKPPNVNRPIEYGINYNHINGITYSDNLFYICLNWLTAEKFGPSGVAVLDEKMNEIDRFEYGWQLHSFTIIDNKKYAICGYSKNTNVNHPEYSCLFVENEPVYIINDNWFCKDFSVGRDYIYVIGGGIANRKDRSTTSGIVIILDKNFNFVDQLIFDNVGEFKGCALNKYDLTRC